MRVKSSWPLSLLFVFSTALLAFSQSSKPADKWANFGDTKLHYFDIGNPKSKNALVLIHGWTCSAEFWRDNMNAFPGYRVIALDLPGHGQSDKPKVTYSMDYFARSVDAVMKEADVKKGVLVGHSMGTPISREFYRLYPDRTLGIVVVDGALRRFFPKETGDAIVAQFRSNYKENSSRFLEGMLTPVKDDALKKFIREISGATPDYVGISAMEEMGSDKIWKDDKINVPVLVLLAQSPFWPADIKEFVANIAPKSDFQMWTGVSHFLHMERPAEFNGQVKGFIVRNKLL